MTRTLEILALGCVAAIVQGAAATFLPPWIFPDLSFLLVFALGIAWRHAASGMVLAVVLGYVADLLSGSLLGQHALLRLFAFGAARLGVRRLGLRTRTSQAAFAGVLSIVNTLMLSALTSYFAASGGLGALTVWHVLFQAALNAAAAPLVVRGVQRITDSFGDDDGGRRLAHLEPRRWRV